MKFFELVFAYAADMRENIAPDARSLRYYESMVDGDGGDLLSDHRMEAMPSDQQSPEFKSELVRLAVKRAAACLLLLECWGISESEFTADETKKIAAVKPDQDDNTRPTLKPPANPSAKP